MRWCDRAHACASVCKRVQAVARGPERDVGLRQWFDGGFDIQG